MGRDTVKAVRRHRIYLEDDMSLMTEINLTDDEMREWEVVRNRLIAALED